MSGRFDMAYEAAVRSREVKRTWLHLHQPSKRKEGMSMAGTVMDIVISFSLHRMLTSKRSVCYTRHARRIDLLWRRCKAAVGASQPLERGRRWYRKGDYIL